MKIKKENNREQNPFLSLSFAAFGAVLLGLVTPRDSRRPIVKRWTLVIQRVRLELLLLREFRHGRFTGRKNSRQGEKRLKIM